MIFTLGTTNNNIYYNTQSPWIPFCPKMAFVFIWNVFIIHNNESDSILSGKYEKNPTNLVQFNRSEISAFTFSDSFLTNNTSCDVPFIMRYFNVSIIFEPLTNPLQLSFIGDENVQFRQFLVTFNECRNFVSIYSTEIVTKLHFK